MEIPQSLWDGFLHLCLEFESKWIQISNISISRISYWCPTEPFAKLLGIDGKCKFLQATLKWIRSLYGEF